MPCPVLGRDDLFDRRARKRREIGEGGICKQQILCILDDRVVPGEVKIVCRYARYQLLRLPDIVGDDHETHGGIDLFHIFHPVDPVFLFQKELRGVHVVRAAQMYDTEVILTVLIAVVLRFHAQPLSDLVLVGQIIVLRLHISVCEHILPHAVRVQVQERLVRARNVRAVLDVVPGVCHVQPVLPLVIDPRKVFLFRRDAKLQIHEIQTALAVDVVCQRLTAQDTVIAVVAHRDAPRRDIAEQLVSKPLPPQ